MPATFTQGYSCERLKYDRPGEDLPAIKIPDHLCERSVPILAYHGTAAITLTASFADLNAGCRALVDLSQYNQFRFGVVATTAAGAATVFRAQYSTDNSTYSDMDTSTDISIAASSTAKEGKSAWTNLPSGAKADCWIRIAAKKAATETATPFYIVFQYR